MIQSKLGTAKIIQLMFRKPHFKPLPRSTRTNGVTTAVQMWIEEFRLDSERSMLPEMPAKQAGKDWRACATSVTQTAMTGRPVIAVQIGVYPAELSRLRSPPWRLFAAHRGRRFSVLIFADHSLKRPAVNLAQRVARQCLDHP
jgi:hypothetical protein